jgi:hypothetical protein
MQLTLRKANALSKSLLETARKLPLPRTVVVSIYATESVQDSFTATMKQLGDNATDALDLSKAAYDLRGLIGAANFTCGVYRLLTEKASLDVQEKFLVSVVEPAGDHDYSLATDTDIALAKLEALRERSKVETARSVTETLTVRVATPDVVAGLRERLLDLRRRKTTIADELLALNTASKIDVPTDIQSLLARFKLV